MESSVSLCSWDSENMLDKFFEVAGYFNAMGCVRRPDIAISDVLRFCSLSWRW